MRPSCAASIGPRNEVSSQGCAITVVAAGTCFASATSFSYLLCGGCSNGPIALMLPISLSFNIDCHSHIANGAGDNARSGSLGLWFLPRGGDHREISSTERFLVEAEQASHPKHPFPVFC